MLQAACSPGPSLTLLHLLRASGTVRFYTPVTGGPKIECNNLQKKLDVIFTTKMNFKNLVCILGYALHRVSEPVHFLKYYKEIYEIANVGL